MGNDYVMVLSLTTTSEMMLMSDYCQGDELTSTPKMMPRSDNCEGDELNDDLGDNAQVRLLSG